MKKALLLIITFIFAGCTTIASNQNYNRITSISLNSLNSQISMKAPLTISQVLLEPMNLEGNELDIEINLQSAKVIEKEGGKYLVRAFEVDENISRLQLRSYVVPVKRKADYLFFPSFTAFNKEKEGLGKVSPNNSYVIDQGILNISFAIPQNTKYLLLHTEPEYLKLGSIEGNEGGLYPSANYSNQNLSVGIAAVLGGAIGGAIAGAISANGAYESASPENYFFGPGGIVDIEVIN